MKKTILLVFMFLFCLKLFSQDSLYTTVKSECKIYKNKNVVEGYIYTLKENDSILIIGQDKPFYKVKYKNNIGYVADYNLNITNDIKIHQFKIEENKIDCNNIEVQNDEFSNKTIYNSPFISDISISKFKKNNKSNYYLSLYAYGYTVVLNETKIIILFSDKTKLYKNSKIDCNVSEKGGFVYSSIIQLNNDDLKLLSTKEISKFRLYVFDNEISESESLIFKEYVKCIIKK